VLDDTKTNSAHSLLQKNNYQLITKPVMDEYDLGTLLYYYEPTIVAVFGFSTSLVHMPGLAASNHLHLKPTITVYPSLNSKQLILYLYPSVPVPRKSSGVPSYGINRHNWALHCIRTPNILSHNSGP
jgi:hypothetical protein